MRRLFTIYSLFFDIRKWISWYQEIKSNFWYQKIDFLISKNRFSDIKKKIFWYQIQFIPYFLISKILFFDIRQWISWYQEIKIIFWYQKIDFLTSRFFDIRYSICWYQEIDFLTSKNDFLISINVMIKNIS